MSTYEHNALQQYIDANGDMHIIYPVTKAENIFDPSNLSVGDSAKLGGETAEQWQGKIDNIQTRGGATFNPQGWYRIAELDSNSQITDNSCFIELKKASTAGESYLIRLESVNQAQRFICISAESGNKVINKLRYTYDSSKTYLEAYIYSSNQTVTFGFSVNIFNGVNAYGVSWRALEFIPTEETVDGVTVVATYNIPSSFGAQNPMHANTEYRTNEYFYGLPVFIINTCVGWCASGAHSFDITNLNVLNPISVDLTNNDNETYTNYVSDLIFSRTNVGYTLKEPAGQVNLILKYTKQGVTA